jgi:hypothetical protein
MEKEVGKEKWSSINIMKLLWIISQLFIKVSGNLTKDQDMVK